MGREERGGDEEYSGKGEGQGLNRCPVPGPPRTWWGVTAHKQANKQTMERRPNTNASTSGSASPAVIKQAERTSTEQGRNRASSLREEAQESQAEKPSWLWRPEPDPGPLQARIPAGLCNGPGSSAQERHVGAACSHHNSRIPPPPPPPPAPAPPAAFQHLPLTHQPRIPLLTNRSIGASAHTSAAPPVWMHRAEEDTRSRHLRF